MNRPHSLVCLSIPRAIGALVIAFGNFVSGQDSLQKQTSEPKPTPESNPVLRLNVEDWIAQGRGIPDDWSHHHLVFSNPGTEEDALANRTYDHWLNVVNDPRYVLQRMKRGAVATALEAEATPRGPASSEPRIHAYAQQSKLKAVKRDWSMDLGPGVAAHQTGSFSGSPLSSGSITVTNGSNTLTMTTNGTAANATGTFSSPPLANTTISITSGSNTLTLSSAGTGTVTFTAEPAQGDTITIGSGNTYAFGPITYCESVNNCVQRNTAANEAQNLQAAINNDASQCAADFVFTSTCFLNGTSGAIPNTSAAASVSGSVITLVNTTGASITVGTTSSAITLSPSSMIPAPSTNACSSSTTGTFAPSSSTTTLASNMAAAINLCPAAAGVSATQSTDTVKVTDTTPGSFTTFSVSDTNNSGIFSWSSVTAGTNGSNACTSSTTGTFATSNSTTTLATDLAAAIALCPAAAGVTASSNGTTVTATADIAGTPGNQIALASNTSSAFAWGGATLAGGQSVVGPGQYPAKFSFSTTTANCGNATAPDYVVYNTGTPGSTTQANIVAYDNIYSGCSGTAPTVYWSYYTGTGSALTSPVLSLDGTKVAFIETPASGGAVLRILKWATGSGNGTDYSAPANITSTDNHTNTYAGAMGNEAWSACTSSPCMISVAFQTEANPDTTSPPWYEYDTDVLWVGDNAGYLHEFTGVFNGTPGELTTASGGTCGASCVWPIAVSTGALTGPVYDQAHSLLFVGASGGHLYSVSATNTTAAVETSNRVGFATADITDPPVVDPAAGAAGEVYLFVSGDAATSPSSGVFQFAEGSISSSSGTEDKVGTGSTGSTPLYQGTFDNAYFTSSNTSGNMWVCGQTGGDPSLYTIPIASGGTITAATLTGVNVVSATPATCSPVSEFCNNGGAACTASAGTDYIFVSPQTQPSSGQVTGCTASEGCVISYSLNTAGTTATLKGAGPSPGGASGMIVDTQSTSETGTLQLYFSNLTESLACAGKGSVGTGTGGCAIQASQTVP